MINVSNSMILPNKNQPQFSYNDDPLSIVRKLQLQGNIDPKILELQMNIERAAMNRKDFIYPVDFASVARANQISFENNRKSNLLISLGGTYSI